MGQIEIPEDQEERDEDTEAEHRGESVCQCDAAVVGVTVEWQA